MTILISLINGVKGTAMQSFKEQLNEVDMAAVITYERNAWGNDTGEVDDPQGYSRLQEYMAHIAGQYSANQSTSAQSNRRYQTLSHTMSGHDDHGITGLPRV